MVEVEEVEMKKLSLDFYFRARQRPYLYATNYSTTGVCMSFAYVAFTAATATVPVSA